MKTSTDIATSLLKLMPGEYFTTDRARCWAMSLELADQDFLGLAVALPAEVDVNQRESLPLLLAWQISAIRDWETPLMANLALGLYDHEKATVTFARIHDEPPGKRPPGAPPARPARPTGDDATGMASLVECLDLRQRFALDWHARPCSAFAISYDWVSNVARTDLLGEAPAAPPPPRPQVPPPGKLLRELPAYEAVDVGVKPVAAGVAFVVDTTHLQYACVVRGTVKMAMSERYRSVATDATRKRFVTVIPVSVVVVGRGWPLPWVFEWGIPAYTDAPALPGTPLQAFFAVPIPADKVAVWPRAEELVAYLVHDGTVYGPQRFTIQIAGR